MYTTNVATKRFFSLFFLAQTGLVTGKLFGMGVSWAWVFSPLYVFLGLVLVIFGVAILENA